MLLESTCFKLGCFALIITSIFHYTSDAISSIKLTSENTKLSTLFESKSVKELGCEEMKPARGLKREHIAVIPSWYVPMASKHYYNYWAEKILKRPMTAGEQSQMCLKVLILAPAGEGRAQYYSIIVGGFRKAVHQKCRRTQKALTQTCRKISDNVTEWRSLQTEETIISHGKGDYIVIARCNEYYTENTTDAGEEWKDWAVLTPDWHPLNDTVKAKIQKVILKYGFNQNYTETLDYSKCSRKTSKIIPSSKTNFTGSRRRNSGNDNPAERFKISTKKG